MTIPFKVWLEAREQRKSSIKDTILNIVQDEYPNTSDEELMKYRVGSVGENADKEERQKIKDQIRDLGIIKNASPEIQELVQNADSNNLTFGRLIELLSGDRGGSSSGDSALIADPRVVKGGQA